jgi:dolichol-phosphate mannosyltransferase
MAPRPRLTLLVPLLNEEAVVPELLARLRATADRLPVDVDFLFVDDGSHDRTPELLREAARSEPRLTVLRFSRNFGHSMALSAGLEEARGDAVAILDADLQDPPELLDQMVARWREGYAVVYGVRRNRKEGRLKRTAYYLFYRLLQHASALDVPIDAGDFCLLDRKVVDVLTRLPERTRYLRGLRAWAGFRQIGIPYDRPARAAGEPKYSWRRLFELGIDGIVSFSHLPLRLASYLGFATALLALAALLFYLVWWLGGFELAGRRPGDAAGFMTLTTLLLFFAGVQLISLGLLGEYVGRIFVEVKRRPGWVVAEKFGRDAAPTPPRPEA